MDDLAPFGHVAEFNDVACAGEAFCVALPGSSGPYSGPGGALLVSTDPRAASPAWATMQIDTAQLNAITCPSASLCAALDASGNLLTSTHPTGGAHAWSAALRIGDGLKRISCPSATFCVAVDEHKDVFVSSDPAGGAGAWAEHGSVGTGINNALACPSASLCVDVTEQESVSSFAATTDPATDARWPSVELSGEQEVDGLSCPSLELCVAVDGAGRAIVSSDPASPHATWTAASLGDQALVGVSCPAELLCVAIDTGGEAITSTNPAGGAGAWGPPVEIDQNASLLPSGAPLLAPGPGEPLGVPVGSPDLSAVACPSTQLCLAADAYGHVLTTTDPSGGAAAWSASVAEPPADAIEAISCPSASLCVALDEVGRVLVTHDPAAAEPAWGAATLPKLADGYDPGLLCIKHPVCLATDTSYEATHIQPVRGYLSVAPAGEAHAWKSVGVLQTFKRSCPSKRLCIVASHGRLIVQLRSSSGRVRSRVPLRGRESCPSFCIEAGGDGLVYVVPHPASGASDLELIDRAPSPEYPGQNARVETVACASSRFCVAFDEAGDILFSRRPTAGPRYWTSIHPDLPAPLTLLRCPSESLCVGADRLGDVITSTDPRDAATWKAALADAGAYITALSCASATLCLAADDSGDVLTGTRKPPQPRCRERRGSSGSARCPGPPGARRAGAASRAG